MKQITIGVRGWALCLFSQTLLVLDLALFSRSYHAGYQWLAAVVAFIAVTMFAVPIWLIRVMEKHTSAMMEHIDMIHDTIHNNPNLAQITAKAEHFIGKEELEKSRILVDEISNDDSLSPFEKMEKIKQLAIQTADEAKKRRGLAV